MITGSRYVSETAQWTGATDRDLEISKTRLIVIELWR
jgi:hypothetical protein